MKYHSITLIVVYLLVSIFFLGCSNFNANLPTTTYKTYQIEPDDIRLQQMTFPLFSFEYPDIFRLIDLNLIVQESGANTYRYGVSKVEFTIPRLDLPEPILSIGVQKVGIQDIYNANDSLSYWTSYEISLSETVNITTNKTSIQGIPAIETEIFKTLGEFSISGHSVYPPRKSIFRGVFFEYNNMVWAIILNWDYLNSEPPEVRQYFDHVIETFKFNN
jgi:hypothetical protein